MSQMKQLIVFVFVLSLAYGQYEAASFDPLQDFCRRFAHRTALIDRRVYIDGGYVDYGGSVSPTTTNYTNTYLLYLDLDNLENQFPLEWANLSKPSYVPSLAGGILWADTVNKYFYMYGGEYNWTTPPAPQPLLWYYDVLNDEWLSKSIQPGPSTTIGSVSFGAGVVVDDRAWAYYYGGWMSNATTLGWTGNPMAQSNLISYDMVEDQWNNYSFIDNTPRAEGVMFYIPASDAGMLVYFGGVQQSPNGSYTGVPMDEIFLYDIASGRPYLQTTTGKAPGMRRRFCGAVSWPEDQSSYNIYFYGGLQTPNEEGFGYGDVWILSIPSFTWTQWFQSESFAHHSLTCNVIDDSQMIIMGGAFPDSSNTGCDVADIWGQHNLNLGADDAEKTEWYQYLPNLTTYQVPHTLYATIGGGPTGGATLTTPANEWATEDLEVYFTRRYTPSTRIPTRDVTQSTVTTSSSPIHKDSSDSNTGAIAGGVVGGVVGLTLFVVLVFCCLRRRRRRRNTNSPAQGGSNAQPLPPTSQPATERHFSGTNALPKPSPSPQMTDDGSSYRNRSAGSPPPHFGYSPPTRSMAYPQPQAGSNFGPNYAPVPVYYVPVQPGQQAQFFTPMQEPQQYFPPPPDPQRFESEQHESPSVEMPSVRSPAHMYDR